MKPKWTFWPPGTEVWLHPANKHAPGARSIRGIVAEVALIHGLQSAILDVEYKFREIIAGEIPVTTLVTKACGRAIEPCDSTLKPCVIYPTKSEESK